MIRLLLPLLFLSFLLPAAHAAGLDDEAKRQLGFAETELADGQFDRALASAESALRLAPTMYGAFVVKALAYEGLGNPRLAESLLLAYQELTRNLSQDPRVAASLKRLAAPDEQPTTGGKRPARSKIQITVHDPTDTAAAEAIAAFDPAPYRARVKAALDDGKCASALAAASEFSLAQPDLPEGRRFLGDAERCAGHPREAVLAYREFKELGGSDPGVDLMLRGLAASLAILDVDIDVPPQGTVAQALLSLGVEVVAGESIGSTSFRFADLPTGQALSMSLQGRGLVERSLDIEPLQPGEHREITAQVEYLGLARIRLLDHDVGRSTTTLRSPDGDALAPPGTVTEVTAADVVALVQGEFGEVQVPLDVSPGASLDFQPTPWTPTALTVVDVPAGVTLRVYVEGLDGAVLERQVEVPLGGGSLDPATGLAIADPVRIDSLIGGVGGLFVQHATLGEASATVVLEPGAANATTFQWRGLPGVAGLQTAYDEWSSSRAAAKRAAAGSTAAFVGLTVASGVASGLLFMLANDAALQADGSRALAIQAVEAADVDATEILAHRATYEDAVAQQEGLTAGAAIAGGVAGVGFAMTVTFGAVGQKKLAQIGTWDPAAPR